MSILSAWKECIQASHQLVEDVSTEGSPKKDKKKKKGLRTPSFLKKKKEKKKVEA